MFAWCPHCISRSSLLLVDTPSIIHVSKIRSMPVSFDLYVIHIYIYILTHMTCVYIYIPIIPILQVQLGLWIDMITEIKHPKFGYVGINTPIFWLYITYYWNCTKPSQPEASVLGRGRCPPHCRGTFQVTTANAMHGTHGLPGAMEWQVRGQGLPVSMCIWSMCFYM